MKQLGFDMLFSDPNTGAEVPWTKFDGIMIQRIKEAAWKVVDLETTGLTPFSEEQNFSGKQLRAGCDPTLRMRVCTILYPVGKDYEVVSYDFDTLTQQQKEKTAEACLTGAMIGWNIGFDTYWLRQYSEAMPELLLDGMLLARILKPRVPVILAEMASDESGDYELFEAAKAVFMGKRSGWSLADVVLALHKKLLPKEKQGPKNWCETFLDQKSFDYACGDVINTLNVVLTVFDLETHESEKLLDRYKELATKIKSVKRLEPQVKDIIYMRETGMPWTEMVALRYVAAQKRRVRRYAKLLVKREKVLLGEHARLGQFEAQLANFDGGITANLKQAIGETFNDLGVVVEVTEKAGTFKIGEKDLRKAKAAVLEIASKLYDPWIRLNKAKKAGNMALEVTAYSKRSKDKRLHPLTGHGPVTGRLSSSEPNCQQFPRDQHFRNAVKAKANHKIIASDYSALDMRVGAALALRAQEQILAVYAGTRKSPAEDVTAAIVKVLSKRLTLEQAKKEEVAALTAFNAHKEILKNEEVVLEGADKKEFWNKYRRLARKNLLARFSRCLSFVRSKAEEAGTETWGMLRDAFNIDGMDIHTWTALGMIGEDPTKLFAGKAGEDVAKELKVWKKKLGDKRQTGKVGNLSLLYAMQVFGLLEAAAKNYNIHWTFEEGAKVRSDWFATYVEIDLWHAWTELNEVGRVSIPDPEKGGRYSMRGYYESVTLGDRLIYAFGLNAALSYEDQSTGADILGLVMDTFQNEHPEVASCIVNQVHDEIVFEVPDEKVELYGSIIQTVMVDSAEFFLSRYGVKGECSPAVGQVWLKD